MCNIDYKYIYSRFVGLFDDKVHKNVDRQHHSGFSELNRMLIWKRFHM